MQQLAGNRAVARWIQSAGRAPAATGTLPQADVSRLTGVPTVQREPMREGRRRRTLTVHWGSSDQFTAQVRRQAIRRLGVPARWIDQVLATATPGARDVYDELERRNPLRRDGEIVRILGEFNANGAVGNSTLTFDLPAAPVPSEVAPDEAQEEAQETAPGTEPGAEPSAVEAQAPETSPEDRQAAMERFAREHGVPVESVMWTPLGPRIRLGTATQQAEMQQRSVTPTPADQAEAWVQPQERALSDADVIRLIGEDPVWQQAYDQATMEFTITRASQLGVSTPSFSVLGNIVSLANNLGTDRPTAEQVRRELLIRTRVWYGTYRRQMERSNM
jgi:multidrug efflux pump subunit AcrB